MQPYLVYGFGIRAKILPEDVKQRLVDTTEVYSWFYEDGAGSIEDDAGVYYLVESTTWTRQDDTKPDLPWTDDLDSILKFKNDNSHLIDAKLIEYDLQNYAAYVEFLCSVTEI